MRVEASLDIAAPASDIWRLVTDPARLPGITAGVTRWEPQAERPFGLGARYHVLMQVGSAAVGGLIEIVEFQEPCDIAWTSVMGVDHRGRWRLRERSPGRTRVTLRLAYSAPGGVLGLLADRIAAPFVRLNLRRSLTQLRDQVCSAAVPAPGELRGQNGSRH